MGSASGWTLGETAALVRQRGTILELCPSSNIQTGMCASVADHPFGVLAEAGFRVTVNCDNRLMSDTVPSKEMRLLTDAFDFSLAHLRRFMPSALRRRIVEEQILPGFARFA